jgi:hypothetical protein
MADLTYLLRAARHVKSIFILEFNRLPVVLKHDARLLRCLKAVRVSD